MPRDSWRPFPTAADRQFWESLPADIRGHLIAAGEALRGKPWEPIPATMFLEFYRSGSKEPYQSTSFRRRDRLGALVLAECAENRGRFHDDIVNGVVARNPSGVTRQVRGCKLRSLISSATTQN